MESSKKTIDHLDKVKLKLTVSPSQHQEAIRDIETNFIYGIDVEGLTPFEKLLFGKSAGDQLQLAVEMGCGGALFGRLARLIFSRIPMNPPFHLVVTIVAIERAEGREVVQAMARMVDDCGDGCSCGCGCG